MKNRKTKSSNFLKIGTLLLGISLLIYSCSDDNIIQPKKDEILNSREKIELISFEELPLELKNKMFSLSKTKYSAKGSTLKKEALNRFFEPEVTIVTSRDGIKTYSLRLKKESNINTFLKQKLSSQSENDCKKNTNQGGGHTVIAFSDLNISDTEYDNNSNFSNPTKIDFSVGYNNILITNFTNLTTQNTRTTYTPTNNTNNWSFLNNTWSTLSSVPSRIWNGIKSAGRWFSRLFKSKKRNGCSGLSRKGGDDNDDGDLSHCIDDEEEAQASIMDSNDFEDTYLNEETDIFEIPLPKELFENRTLTKTGTSISNEDFDCACENDQPLSIAQFLELDTQQTLFLADDIQKYLRKEICQFVRNNNYSAEAKKFAKKVISTKIEEPNAKIDFDDRIINTLKGEALCVYEKLKTLKLFKSTIKKFEGDAGGYNLILKHGTCNNNPTNEGCTDAEDSANGNITIKFNGMGNNNLDFAATILHEGIHAEIYKYVDEHKKGINPNKRANLLWWYFKYKAENNNTIATSEAQHQHMADKYVKPIARAIRQLDNYKYPLDYYMGFGWDGLRDYGFDEYYDNGVKILLTKNKSSEYYKKQSIVNKNSDFNKKCN